MKEEKEEESNYIVPGLERGLRILCQFKAAEPVLSATELSKRLKIPRSSAFRLIQTLEHLGFLTRADNERGHRLGMAVLRLGYEYLASLELIDLGRPIIEKLRASTGYSAHITIRDGSSIIFVAKAASPSAIFSSVNVGTRLPAHATVLGRLSLCELSDEELDKLYPEKTLPTFTDQTPRTLKELKQLLKADRNRGYAVSESFYQKDISVIAAPVRDSTGDIVAVISITVTAPSIDDEILRNKLVKEVLVSAEELSSVLNYQPKHHLVSGLRV